MSNSTIFTSFVVYVLQHRKWFLISFIGFFCLALGLYTSIGKYYKSSTIIVAYSGEMADPLSTLYEENNQMMIGINEEILIFHSLIKSEFLHRKVAQNLQEQYPGLTSNDVSKSLRQNMEKHTQIKISYYSFNKNLAHDALIEILSELDLHVRNEIRVKNNNITKALQNQIDLKSSQISELDSQFTISNEKIILERISLLNKSLIKSQEKLIELKAVNNSDFKTFMLSQPPYIPESSANPSTLIICILFTIFSFIFSIVIITIRVIVIDVKKQMNS